MRNVKYKYYHIDIRDIWGYERDLFLSDRSAAPSFIASLQRKVKRLIILVKKPFDYTKVMDEFSYVQAYNLYMGGDLIKHIELPYFIHKKQMYKYDKPLLVMYKHHEFDFWFALKLAQYESGLRHIENFLNYQLAKNFDNDTAKMHKFLVLLLRQYEGVYFSDHLAITVEEFMEAHLTQEVPQPETLPKEEAPTLRSQHKKREFRGHYKTLVLEKGLQDSSYYTKNAIRFAKVNRLLKEQKFIDRKTNEKHFTAIFTTTQIHPSNRVKWIGTIKELQWFVKYLVYETKKVIHLRNDIWVATIHCFVNKKGEEYTDTQLRSAKGKNQERKYTLEQILAQL